MEEAPSGFVGRATGPPIGAGGVPASSGLGPVGVSAERLARQPPPGEQAAGEERDADELREGQAGEEGGVVVAQAFDEEPGDRVGHHQQGHHLAVAPAAGEEGREQAEQDHAVEHRVELGRMHRQRPGGVGREPAVVDVVQPGQGVGRERRRPGEVADRAEAAAVEQAAHPPQRDADGQRGGHGVAHRPERERVPHPVHQGADQAADDAPVKDDPALPDLEDVPEAVHGVRVPDQEQGPGPDEAAGRAARPPARRRRRGGSSPVGPATP